MNLRTWLDEERGRYTALAAHLGVSVGRVSQMADNGCTTRFMLSVRDFTGGGVSLEELVEARTPEPAHSDFSTEGAPAIPPTEAA